MGGVINTGVSYGNKALSGMVRQSAQQQEIDRANAELEGARKAQSASTTGQMVGAGALVGGVAGTAYGAEIGSAVGSAYPGVGTAIGAVAGAALGWLFSKLF